MYETYNLTTQLVLYYRTLQLIALGTNKCYKNIAILVNKVLYKVINPDIFLVKLKFSMTAAVNFCKNIF